ncbi:MAG: L-aspartate oxidase [Victivallales bacterium]|nr:L-aspartate oxidase [Victivallales bacterium]
MNEKNCLRCDFLIIGSGVAGLNTALHLADYGSVVVISKRRPDECNTRHAQGGIACVVDKKDSFDEHVQDTLEAGAGLCDEKAVRAIVEGGPDAVKDLIDRGAHFTTRGELGDDHHGDEYHLGKEGGHHRRRILHAGDITGAEIERILLASCQQHPGITILDFHMAIDLITVGRLGWIGENRCMGAYALDARTHEVMTITACATVVATGGCGKVYLYTSNAETSCGAGVAMCYRANVPIANMEFFQFHPTILFHPEIHSFLISEAVRGEGAVLKRKGPGGQLVEFMDKYHEMKSLAPRDVVARAIDNEMKRTGEDCVYLDIRNQSEEALRKRFPNIFQHCLDAGINMAHDLIPVVPAAHYSCGGVLTDINGYTGIKGLYAIGEVAYTGLHGANRLASNSLLEALVVSRFAARDILAHRKELEDNFPSGRVPVWSCGNATDSDEMVVIPHNWDEIRRFMWDFVGIVRTNKRLERAKSRIKNIRQEIEKYYWDFYVTPDLVELRNIALVAEIIIDSALSRKESRGLHYNADYPHSDPDLANVNTIIQKPYSR